MSCQPESPDVLQSIVNNYFDLIGDLRSGTTSSVDSLMALWDPEGTFEFAGASPVVATYKGAVAINTLYKNRLNSSGMAVELETTTGQPDSTTLGTVSTTVLNTRIIDNRVIVGWRTTIGTADDQGFDVAGSHLFLFEGDKIKNLRVTVSPKADRSTLSTLSMGNLAVSDIGRLSLAAWPVV